MQATSKALGITPPFEAYSGDGPYTFISYAHADKVIVFNAMRQLYERGANMWYDEGIKPAGEWVEEIAHAIKASSLFLVFISPRSVDSRYVRSEVGYALSENKEVLTVFVEDTTLPAGLSLCLQQFNLFFCRMKIGRKKHWRPYLKKWMLRFPLIQSLSTMEKRLLITEKYSGINGINLGKDS